MLVNPATVSAMSALAGSAVGALASVATTWLTQHHQGRMQRLGQEASRRERLFCDFIDQASTTYADGMVREGLDDPAKLVSIYATMNKLRLFASQDTIRTAEAVLEGILETYEMSPSAVKMRTSDAAARDIVRGFAESCRAELAGLR